MKTKWHIDLWFAKTLFWGYEIACVALAFVFGHYDKFHTWQPSVAFLIACAAPWGALVGVAGIVAIIAVLMAIGLLIHEKLTAMEPPIRRVTVPITKDLRKVYKEKRP